MKTLYYQIIQDWNDFENRTYSVGKEQNFTKQKNIWLIIVTIKVNDSQYGLNIMLK